MRNSALKRLAALGLSLLMGLSLAAQPRVTVSGTTWYTMAGGEASGKYVTDGNLKVEVSGDVYTITLTSSVINAQYKGKLSAE